METSLTSDLGTSTIYTSLMFTTESPLLVSVGGGGGRGGAGGGVVCMGCGAFLRCAGCTVLEY